MPYELILTPIRTGWRADEERWEVVLELCLTNTGATVFELDKPTACAGGQLQNHVFDVQGPAGEVSYQGMMKKRAPPESFFQVEPGGTHREHVDLGARYAFPAEGGTFEVRFDHFNHFAKDAEQLVSPPLTLTLTR